MLKKLLSAEQIRKADQYTIKHEPISSLDLMERASETFCSWFEHNIPINGIIHVFAGTGNNGGDALAISRILYSKGLSVTTYIIGDTENGSPDFRNNLLSLARTGVPIKKLKKNADFPSLVQSDILIDGLFGSGLSRPIIGIHAELVAYLNSSSSTIISIDIASGLASDIVDWSGPSITPTHTVSFELSKLAFFSPENEMETGEIHIIPIGLHKAYFKSVSSQYHLVDHDVMQYLPTRKKFMHKGDAGKTLLIAGSKGMVGAAVLSGIACMRAGTGLLTIHTPGDCYQIIQSTLPEALASIDDNPNIITNIPYETISNFDAIAVGPGIGTATLTKAMLRKTLDKCDKPVILDADALNILANDSSLFLLLPPESILTPHVKEFERIAVSSDSFTERLKKQITFSKKYQLNIVVKGANSVITDSKGMVYFNTTGNPGMATAGTGDVLTGVILGLLGQKLSPLKALLLGVYLHGLAGDIAKNDLGEYSIIASDLTQYLAYAFLSDIEK